MAFNPFMMMMEENSGGYGRGSSIPEQVQPPNIMNMYMRGMALRNQMQDQQRMDAVSSSEIAANQAKIDEIKQTQLLNQGVSLYLQGGKPYNDFIASNPAMKGEIENKGLQIRAAATIAQGKAQTQILSTIPLDQPGFDLYNSPAMRQKFSSLQLPHPEYKNLQDFRDGIQSITDTTNSIYGNSSSYGMMVRQYTDPNSPLYKNEALGSQIQALHQKIVQQGQSRTPKTPTPPKLSDGDIRGIVGQNLGLLYPDITNWGSSNPGEYKNLIDGLTGQVQAELRKNPKADPNTIAQQFVHRVERKGHWYSGGETFSYNPNLNQTPPANTNSAHPPVVINGKTYVWGGGSTQ